MDTPQFDPSCIFTFTIPGDAVNTYAMIDAKIVAAAKAGLTAAQQAALDAYTWTPATDVEIAATPTWAGNDPQPVYFRTTQAKLQAALARWYK